MAEVLKLSAPWICYYRKIDALFGEDPDVSVKYDEDINEITLLVNGQEKANALTQLLPTEKSFGNVTIKITIVPANKPVQKIDLFKTAFEGNPAFSYAVTVDTGMTSNTFNYCVFRNKVVQYFGDNLNDVNGNISTLYECIAKDVFEDTEGILFCTDVPNNLGQPLREWP